MATRTKGNADGPRRRAGLPWIATVVAAIAGGAAFVLMGAHIVAQLGRGGLGEGAALAAALIACVAVPIALGVKVAGEARRLPVVIGALATCDVIWLALMIGIAPSASRAAVATHGDWLLFGREVPIVRTAMRALGAPEVPAPEPVEAVATVEVDASTVDADASAMPASAAEPVALPELPLSARELFAQRADAVVTVHVRVPIAEDDPLADMYRRLGVTVIEARGSGFVVDGGLVVTNHHVVRGAESARVQLRDGRTFDSVRVVASDPANDLDLIAIDTTELPIVPLAPDDAVEVGARVFAIGSPLGLDHTLTEGIVSASREQGGTTMIQTQAPIAPGSSGGPLFDERGRLLGVNTATRTAGMHFSVHVRHVRELLAAERSERALAQYVEGVRVDSVEMRGAPMSPVSRMHIEQIAIAAARIAGTCIETWPEGDAPVVTIEARRTRRAREGVTSDQGAIVDRCLHEGGTSLPFFAGMQLQSEGDASMTVRVVGVGATADDPGHAVRVHVGASP